MSFEYQSEKREFVRIATSIPVRYKYLSHTVDLEDATVYEGSTSNLSGAGLLLIGRIPSMSWIPALLMDKIHIGINMLLPSLDMPVKALCRVSWIEALKKGSDKGAVGLK